MIHSEVAPNEWLQNNLPTKMKVGTYNKIPFKVCLVDRFVYPKSGNILNGVMKNANRKWHSTVNYTCLLYLIKNEQIYIIHIYRKCCTICPITMHWKSSFSAISYIGINFFILFFSCHDHQLAAMWICTPYKQNVTFTCWHCLIL
jgi:hypothetical protein